MENKIRLSDVTIQGWMTIDLGLKGNELLVYALIYSFSKDGETEFYGNRRYISKWFNMVNTTVDNTLKSLMAKGLIIKCTEEKNGIIQNHYRANLDILINENDTPTKNWYTLPKIGTPPYQNLVDPLPKIGTQNTDNYISDSNIYNNTSNNLRDNINNENIINRENTGFLNKNPAHSTDSSKNLFSKNTKTNNSNLKDLVSNSVVNRNNGGNTSAKNTKILDSLKVSVFEMKESNEVKEVLYKWLDILFENKKLMTKDQLYLAMEYLNKATNDESVKIEAIKIASMKGYRDFEYTIDKAKENLHKKKDLLNFSDQPLIKISDIAERKMEEFKEKMEKNPEKYKNIPEVF